MDSQIPEETTLVRVNQFLRALHSVVNELASSASTDELFRRVVELGQRELKLDRLSVWLCTDDPTVVQGTFGVDEHGALRDERDANVTLVDDALGNVLRDHLPWQWLEADELHDHRGDVIGSGSSVVVPMRHKGGTVVGCLCADNLLTGHPLTEEDCPLLCLFADSIGELYVRLSTEQRLRESESLFGELFDHIQIGVAIFRAVDDGDNFVFVDMNPAGAKLDHVDRSRIQGELVTKIFPAVGEFGLLEVFQQVWRDGISRSHPVSLYADGRIRAWRENEVYKLPSGDLVAVYADVSDRKRAEEALREARNTLQVILDSIPVRVFWKDLDSRYLGCNKPFAKDAGMPAPEDVIGKSDSQMVWSAQAEMWRKEDTEVIESGESKVWLEQLGVRVDNSEHWFRKSKGPLRNANGDIVGVLGTNEDVTEERNAQKQRKRMEEQIQHTQKLESLGVLAGGIAHDFNNLLAGILGNADLALSDAPKTSPIRESLQDIMTASRRASDLCKQLLAYSGKGRFVVQTVNLSALVQEMGHMLEVTSSKSAALKYNLNPQLPPVMADATQMRQIVMNLIINASEAIGESSGIISVTTDTIACDAAYLRSAYVNEALSEGTYVSLEVSDTGCGMDKATQDRIFDPFFTTKFTGRGLGLAAVLGIVRGHGGALKVYSEPGRGSTFKVILPVSEGEHAPCAQQEPRSAQWRGSGSVLLIDDEDVVRVTGRRMLERAGFDVILARDGEEGLALFRENLDSIVCVLLDLTMPGMGGEQTYRELRRVRSDVKVIMSSGYNEQDVTQRFVGKGLAGFIQKPYSSDDLLAELRRVLES